MTSTCALDKQKFNNKVICINYRQMSVFAWLLNQFAFLGNVWAAVLIRSGPWHCMHSQATYKMWSSCFDPGNFESHYINSQPLLSAASAPVSSSVSRRRAPSSVTPLSWEKQNIAAMSSITIDPELKPGEFVIKSLFAEFAVLAEKKIEMVMAEPLVSLQRLISCVKMHRKLNL